MPASLPPQSAYTYCVELSVDEALAAGATTVQFSKPVSFYVENFLGFPAGTQVPLGFYDLQKSAWIPAPDGRVIRIVAIESGIARVDTDGDGLADDNGLDTTERQQLASLYGSGTSLWRLTMNHFTRVDANYSSAVTVDGTAPNGQATWFPAGACPTTIPNNSTIECQNQTLGEAVPVTGAPFEMHYQSDRTPGRIASRTIDIPLSGATIPAGLKRIELEITVAGRTTHQSFPATAGRQFRFVWDGLDVFGRPITGGAPVTVRTSYVYDAQYLVPARVPVSFSLASGVPSGVPARLEVSATQMQQGILGSWHAAAERMGGWTISPHHFYDPASKILYRGDGTRKTDSPARFGVTTGVLSTIAGNGTVDNHWTGAGGPASAATISRMEGMTVGPDGSIYLASQDFIHKITPDGVLRRIAGVQPNPIPTPSPELETTQNAVTAHVFRPRGMSVGPDGSLYVAEPRNRVVRRITPDGQITPFAGVPGNCNICFTDNMPARTAQLSFPEDVAAAPDGSVYIQDSDNSRVRRVDPNGFITTVAGNGAFGFAGDGGPAVAARLGQMNGIALGPDGSLYIAEESRIRRVGPDGIITTVAGNGIRGTSGDGGPATSASIFVGWGGARAFSVGSDGSIYFADDARVRRIDPTGTITTVAGTRTTLPTDTTGHDGEFGTASDLTHIDAMTTTSDGLPYFSEFGVWKVRALQPSLPVFTPSASEIAVADGSLLYIFTPRGQHLRTIDAETGAVLYSFSYTNGVLATITDVAGNITTIERDGAGDATAVIASGGQRTEISGAPYATTITTALGETTQFTYAPDGLMTGKTDARNNSSVFTWNELGLLGRDAGPDGGSVDASRTEIADGHVSVMTTAGGKTTRYTTTAPGNGDNVSTIVDPAGFTITSIGHEDGSSVTTFPDGVSLTLKDAADPLWSTQSPFISSATLRLPSGQTSVVTMTRDATTSQPGNPQTVATRTDNMTVNGRTFRRVFDRVSLTDTLTTPANRVITHRRDSAGRVIERLLPALAPLDIGYDERGRVQSISRGSRQQTFAYNTRNELTSVTDALNRTTRFEYDAAERVRKQILPDLREIQFSYDSNGNITSVTPPSRPAHAFTFTPANLLGGYIPPVVLGGGATTFRYNADRQLTLITRPDGDTVTPMYDGAGRISALQTSTTTLTYDYDSAGRLATVSNSAGSSLGYAYDGRLLKQQQWSGPVSGAVSYDYDADLRLASENGVSYAYDADGLLIRAGALAVSRAADSGFLTGTTIGTLSDAYTYNAFGETSEYSLIENGMVAFDEKYLRDNAGRITSRTDVFNGTSTTTTTIGYGYDTAGHLASVTRDGTQIAAYSYNENGARLAKTLLGATYSATYDEQDRLLTYGGTTYSYTANGELLTKTDMNGTTSYTYDEFGNLRTVALPDGKQIEYVIDGQNRRVGKKVNGTLVRGWLYGDQLRIVAELDGTGAIVSQFVYGTQTNVPDYMLHDGQTYRFITDHVGSPRFLIDIEAHFTQIIDYDEFGNVLGDSAPGFQPFGFAGGLYDADTGLVRFGARDYDPQTGRWTTKDPIGFAGGATNFYDYLGGDPVNSIDPTGLSGLLTVNSMTDQHEGSSAELGAGHSWITYTPDGGVTTTYSTWGGMNTRNIPAGLQENVEPQIGGYTATTQRRTHIDDAGEARLMDVIAWYKKHGWSINRPCSSFAHDAWMAGTGENLHYQYHDFSNPTSLDEGILQANHGIPYWRRGGHGASDTW
jgi:RHS repeat-associated protein